MGGIVGGGKWGVKEVVPLIQGHSIITSWSKSPITLSLPKGRG